MEVERRLLVDKLLAATAIDSTDGTDGPGPGQILQKMLVPSLFRAANVEQSMVSTLAGRAVNDWQIEVRVQVQRYSFVRVSDRLAGVHANVRYESQRSM